MKTLILSAVTCFMIIPASHAEPEIKGSASELANYLSNLPRVVMLTGEGEVKTNSDRALVTLKVATEHKSLADALRANDQVRSRMAAFLRDEGIGSERVHASKFSSIPKHALFSDKVKVNRVENQVEIIVQNEKELQAVAAVPDKFSEASYVSVEFQHSDKEKLRIQAASQACDDAERHKRIFEEKLGLKLTPRSFVEQIPTRSFNAPRIRVQGGSAPLSNTPLPGYGDVQEERTDSVSSFGELSFKVLVHVEYVAESKQKP